MCEFPSPGKCEALTLKLKSYFEIVDLSLNLLMRSDPCRLKCLNNGEIILYILNNFFVVILSLFCTIIYLFYLSKKYILLSEEYFLVIKIL